MMKKLNQCLLYRSIFGNYFVSFFSWGPKKKISQTRLWETLSYDITVGAARLMGSLWDLDKLILLTE
jgi:hypothetical protein